MTQHCPNPFEWLDITAWNGDTVKLSICVESWSGTSSRLAILPFSEAAQMDVSDLWNAPSAHASRKEAIDNGRANFCNACPKWASGDDPVLQGDAPDRTTFSAGPKTLNLAYDHSCNLQCPSCRRAPICHSPGSEKYTALRAFQNNVIRPLLRTADRAYLAGLGDPFGSPCYSELLATTQPEDAPTLKWYILTNGQGFTPERYTAIPTHRQIDKVQFSIDAATEETYALNRQSDWGRLCENLAFVGGLRCDGVLDQLDISMVVQKNNYKEAIQFIDFAKANSVDNVLFSCLLPMRGVLIDVAERSVMRPKHPEYSQAIARLESAKLHGKDIGVNVMVEVAR